MMATTFQDYYKTLGVERAATAKEIKSAYRKLARKYHPDVNSGDAAAEAKFKQITEAHEVLRDPEKRRRYDEVGEHWQDYEAWERAGKPRGGNPFATSGGGGNQQFQSSSMSAEEMEQLFGGNAGFSDFFQDIFGAPVAGSPRGRPRARPQRGSDVEGDTNITLEEAYTGTTRTIELSGGRGVRRVEVRIPQGVADEARVRASGQGADGRAGGAAGDLYIRVHVLPHPRFTRDGDTLRVAVPVPLDVALIGGSIDVPTLRGRSVSLTVPAETQNGARLRLRGLGMPGVRGEAADDLIAEVKVQLPLPLTERTREIAADLRRALAPDA